MDNQDSLRLAEVDEMVGDWRLVSAETSCTVRFTAQNLAAANAYRLGGDTGCLSATMAIAAMGWRAAPDGIALVDAGGGTLIFFDAQGRGRTRAGVSVRLARVPPAGQP